MDRTEDEAEVAETPQPPTPPTVRRLLPAFEVVTPTVRRLLPAFEVVTPRSARPSALPLLFDPLQALLARSPRWPPAPLLPPLMTRA